MCRTRSFFALICIEFGTLKVRRMNQALVGIYIARIVIPFHLSAWRVVRPFGESAILEAPLEVPHLDSQIEWHYFRAKFLPSAKKIILYILTFRLTEPFRSCWWTIKRGKKDRLWFMSSLHRVRERRQFRHVALVGFLVPCNTHDLASWSGVWCRSDHQLIERDRALAITIIAFAITPLPLFASPST